MGSPKTLTEAIRYFFTPDNCREYLVARRWQNGVTCPLVWLVTNCKNDVSSYDIHRAVGVTQTPRGSCSTASAWQCRKQKAAGCSAAKSESMKP